MRSNAATLERPRSRPGAKPVMLRRAAGEKPEPATTTTDAVRQCRRLANDLNATGFSLLFLAKQGESRRLAPVFDAEFPGLSPLSRVLSSRAAESVAQLASRHPAPLSWRGAQGGSVLIGAASHWAHEIERPQNLPAGIAFPVSFEKARTGIVAFTGADMLIDEVLLCEMHARCFALFADVVRQRMKDTVKAPMVSKRETECLRLTASGLTSEDIAGSLGLSVHTANQYLTNSTHKLNAVNRIHAVAKALRSGLID